MRLAQGAGSSDPPARSRGRSLHHCFQALNPKPIVREGSSALGVLGEDGRVAVHFGACPLQGMLQAEGDFRVKANAYPASCVSSATVS